MKRKLKYFIIMSLVTVLCSCGKSETQTSDTVKAEEALTAEVLTDEAETADAEDDTENTDVDYDLTQMSGDMVYATVYQMLVNPDDYIGKSVRMSGQYYASYYDVTEQYYHYCIIADATSCCSQGMEFVVQNEELVYPDDYTEIVVEGIFGTYDELDVTYYCLLEATLTQA